MTNGQPVRIRPARLYFRVLDSENLAVTDFMSAKEKGEPLRLPHTSDRLRLWEGVSVFDSLDAARSLARRRQPPRRWIAVLRVQETVGIHIEKTGRNPSHHTV